MSFARAFSALPGLTIPATNSMTTRSGQRIISFAAGSPQLKDLPGEALLAATEEAYAMHGDAVFGYGPPEGVPELRSALVTFFGREGLDASDGRLLVTTGAIQGLDLIFRLLLDPGDLVIVERPTYADVLVSLSTYGVEIAELPMDHDGALVDELPELILRSGKGPKLIYLMPTFHNPTGVTLASPRRLRLLEIAKESGALVVEDNPYGELRFRGRREEALAFLDRDVIAVRSLSKLVAPGLRVGCIVAPPVIVERVLAARPGVDICSPTLSQYIAASFLDGQIDDHLGRLRKVFAARRDVMLEALSTQFADSSASWTDPDGGIFMWMKLPPQIDTAELLPVAFEEGVAFVPGAAFHAQPQRESSLRLCFAALDEEGIAEGVRRLRVASDRLDSTTHRPPGRLTEERR